MQETPSGQKWIYRKQVPDGSVFPLSSMFPYLVKQTITYCMYYHLLLEKNVKDKERKKQKGYNVINVQSQVLFYTLMILG